MEALTSAELVELIEEYVPDLKYAEPSAKTRLRLMAGTNYIHAGYYTQTVAEECVTLNNINGTMSDMHIENMVDTIAKHNDSRDASGYYFVTHGDGFGKYNYSFYYVSV